MARTGALLVAPGVRRTYCLAGGWVKVDVVKVQLAQYLLLAGSAAFRYEKSLGQMRKSGVADRVAGWKVLLIAVVCCDHLYQLRARLLATCWIG
jgi:hypothetical protein